MNLKDDCLRNKGNEKDSIVVCKDTRGESLSQYRLTNEPNSVVSKYELDGCLISDNDTERCDFLLTIQGANKTPAVFIELKGKNLLKAINQINSAIEKLNPDKRQYKVFARIVMSAVPKLQTPAYTKLVEKTAASQGNLKIKSRILSETTAELL